MIGSDGADRAKIAEIVFNDPDQLDWLEELLHPRVVQENLAVAGRRSKAGPSRPR